MATTDIGIKVVVLGVSEAHRQIGAIRNDLSRMSAQMRTGGNVVAQFGKDMTKAGDAMISFGRTLTFAISAPILGATTALVNAGAGFEDAFAGVTKTVDGVALGFDALANQMYGTATGLSDVQKQAVFANESFGDLTTLGTNIRNEFRSLSKEIPITADELSRVGQISGQLGVHAEDITNFTETMALLGTTTDLSAEQAAFAIARLGNILGVQASELDTFAKQSANVLVALGNTAAATEPEIANLALRLGAAGRIANLSTPEILGLSASLAEMGVKAERGGTAVSRVIYEMIEAIGDGGENLDMFAEIAGKSADEFATLFKQDAVGAIQIFVTRLAELQEAGQVSSDTLTALGLSGVRVREVMNILGPNFSLVRENIALANKEWQEQIALQEEATKRFNTIKSQLQLVKNAFADLGITIFDLVRDDIERLARNIIGLIDKFQSLDPVLLKTIIRFGLLASAIGPALIISGSFLQLLGGNITFLAKFGAELGKILRLPFSPFLGFFGTLFGTKTKGLDITKGFNLSKILKQIELLTTKIWTQFVDTSIGSVKFIASGIQKTLAGAFSVVKYTGGFLTNTVKDLFFGIVSSLTGGLMGGLQGISNLLLYIIETPINLLEDGLKALSSLFVGAFKGAANIISQIPNLLYNVITNLPKFGFAVIKNVINPLSLIPKLIPVIAGGFALLFAPDVIKGLIKNWDKVLGEVKTSISQFVEDVKNSGIEKAILLFVSGGSTGSGRKGGLLGIARALGASEENARRFSYAMGTATYWMIEIVKRAADLVSWMFTFEKRSQGIADNTETAGNKFVTLAENIAKFLEGFLVGWESTIYGFGEAWVFFTEAVSSAMKSLGELFTTIFGSAEDEVQSFYDTLAPGAITGAQKVGAGVGQVFGQILTFGVQVFTILTKVIDQVIQSLTQIVTAYREGGVKGVFEELGPIVASLFDGFITIAGELWDIIQPKAEAFVNSMVNWLSTTGVQSLKAGAESLFGVIREALDNVLFGETKRGLGGFAVFDQEMQLKGKISPDAFKEAQVTGELLGQSIDNFIFKPIAQDIEVPGLIAKFQEIIKQIYNFLTSKETWQSIWDGAKSAWEGFSSFVEEDAWPYLKPKLEKFLSDLFNAISDWVTGTGYPAIKDAAGDLIRALGNALIDEAESIGEDVWNRVGNALLGKDSRPETLQEQLEFGKGMIQQVEMGMMSREEALKQVSENIVDKDIRQAMEEVLEAMSPSGVAIRIGQSVIDGLTLGLNQTDILDASIANVVSKFTAMQMQIIGTVRPVYSELTNLHSFATTMTARISELVRNAFNVLSGTALGGRIYNSTTLNYQPSFTNATSQSVQQNNNLYNTWITAVG